MSKEEISIEEQPLCSHITTEIPIKFEPLKQEKYKYSEEEKKAIEQVKNLLKKCKSFYNANIHIFFIRKSFKLINKLEEKYQNK